MEIYQRVKQLRKENLKVTQDYFSTKIKISRSNLASIEVGRISVTERVIQDISTAFNINEHWLRTGEGEMLNENNQSLINELTKEYNLDDLDKSIIETYLKLNDSHKTAIKTYIVNLCNNISSNNEQAAMLDIDREVEAYRQELEAEQKGAILQVSDATREAK